MAMVTESNGVKPDMAKQRRQKQKEHRASGEGIVRAEEVVTSTSPCSVVRHQKLCVAIDIAAQRIYGHTELKVSTQSGTTGGVIGLHAHGLHIDCVSVDGVPADFEFTASQSRYDHQELQASNGSDLAPYLGSQSNAADLAYSQYVGDLHREMQPDLLIFPPSVSTPVDGSQEPPPTVQVKVGGGLENGSTQIAQETKPEVSSTVAVAAAQAEEQVRVVRVEYWVERPAAGAHFDGSILHTHNQLRRARCWFPCVDSPLQCCSYDLEFTVDAEYVAVSSGKLLHQVYSKQGTHLKTYVYSLSIPTAASFISLVVGPLVVLPDRHNPTVSHFGLPGYISELQCSVSFFHSVFSLYEEYLGAPFPFGCYNQVFIPGEASISSSSVGSSMAIFSADLLADEHIIDQAIGTRIKLANRLAQQWFGNFIAPEAAGDVWLLEGLVGFLTDLYIKRLLGNNEARFRRYKANEAVCLVEVEGAPVLSPPVGLELELCGTESLGDLGKIRSWKATAVIQMLEKQMGPEPFRKILQRVILRAQDPVRHVRTLSTKEFRHFANKLGNLERPFLKEFFPRWVESSGCPRLRMGFVYSKRRNMVELAVRRVSTAVSRPVAGSAKTEGAAGKLRAADMGWPGMMSIRLHELDGMYDHPSLPMAGDALQLLELQCHSKLAGRRIQRPKKGTKADAAEDNVESTPAAPSLESPLLWLRADPELEYLAELNLLQPEQMWIYQLEKDRDVVGQSQAIAALRAHSRASFAIVNALNNCLTDSKVFCRVRMEAASALASTASEVTSWAGLQHLIKYYKSCRFDPDIGLPRSNDFHDFAEYFVLEAIPRAVADVRGSDGTSPPEAVDFILTILKHNDNSGNAYSDVFWLASVIESVSSLEFGQQNLQTLLRMLKQIDRFLQYDRLMPSYNGVVSISCIHTLTKLALRLSQVLPLERVKRLLQPFTGGPTTRWQVRVAAMKALVDLEVQAQGLQAAVTLAVHFMEADPLLRVQSKVMKHLLHVASNKKNGTLDIGGYATAELLSLLRSSTAFRNVLLRHHLFSFLQVLAGRSAAIYRLVDNKSKATPGQVTLEKKSVGNNNNNNNNVTSKAGSFKVRLRPTETPLAPRVEPIKLRLPGRPNLPRDNPDRAESGSSGGKRDVDEQEVGKLKLKIKTSSSSMQEGAGDDVGQAIEVSTGAVTKGPVNVNSPVSVDEVVKQEVEDASLLSQDGTSYKKGMQVKEAQKPEPRYKNKTSGGDENPQLSKYEDAAATDSSLRAIGQQGRQLSGGRYLLTNVEMNGGDTADHDVERKSILSRGGSEGVEVAGAAELRQYTSLLEGAGTESTHDGGGDTPSQKQEGERSDKKEKKNEKKEKDRKERKEKKSKKRDKHKDPEYQEKKRKRREEKEKDQRHHDDEEAHRSTKVEVKPLDRVVASEPAKPEGGDTKLRLKIKKPRTNL